MKIKDIAQYKELATLHSRNAMFFTCLILANKNINYAVIVCKDKDDEVDYTILVDLDEKQLGELHTQLVKTLYCLL